MKRVDGSVYIAGNRRGIKKGGEKIVGDVTWRDGPWRLWWL
jgi:hypothetical protein